MELSRVQKRRDQDEMLNQVQKGFDWVRNQMLLFGQQQAELVKMVTWLVEKMDAEPLTKEWYTVAEYASLKNMKPETIRKNYCQTGRINARKADPSDPRSPWLIHKSEMAKAYQMRTVDFGRV